MVREVYVVALRLSLIEAMYLSELTMVAGPHAQTKLKACAVTG